MLLSTSARAAGPVLEGDADARRGGWRTRALAADGYRAGVGGVEPERQAQDGGLAAARGADQGGEGARRAVEVETPSRT